MPKRSGNEPTRSVKRRARPSATDSVPIPIPRSLEVVCQKNSELWPLELSPFELRKGSPSGPRDIEHNVRHQPDWGGLTEYQQAWSGGDSSDSSHLLFRIATSSLEHSSSPFRRRLSTSVDSGYHSLPRIIDYPDFAHPPRPHAKPTGPDHYEFDRGRSSDMELSGLMAGSPRREEFLGRAMRHYPQDQSQNSHIASIIASLQQTPAKSDLGRSIPVRNGGRATRAHRRSNSLGQSEDSDDNDGNEIIVQSMERLRLWQPRIVVGKGGESEGQETGASEVADDNKDVSPSFQSTSQLSVSTQSTEFSSPSSGGSLLSRSEQKQELLERLMRYFYAVWDPHRTLTRLTDIAPGECAAGSSTTSPSSVSASRVGRRAQAGGSAFPNKPQKRGLEPDEDDDGDGPEEKMARLSEETGEPERRLACPFFKKCPERYSLWRSCPGPGWSSVHRIKEHLYRSHCLPVTCPRCHKQFDKESDLSLHLTLEERCQLSVQPRPDGVDATTRDLLRSRKKRHGSKQMTEAEKWRDVYLILFPETDSTSVPTPYYEHGASALSPTSESADPELARYEQFLRRELPGRVRRQLENRIEEALDPVEERLRGQIVEIVRDMQLELFEMYKSDRRRTEGQAAVDAVATTAPPPLVSVPAAPASSDPDAKIANSAGAEPPQLIPLPQPPPPTTTTNATDLLTWEQLEAQLELYRPEPYFDVGTAIIPDELLFNYSHFAQVSLEMGTSDVANSIAPSIAPDSGYWSIGSSCKGKEPEDWAQVPRDFQGQQWNL